MVGKRLMKVATVIGTRPQMIKAAAVSVELAGVAAEVLIHTGQHYDPTMSDIFFAELPLPKPKYNLRVGSGSHGVQTGWMLIRLEEVLLDEKPDLVLVYGDTNSTLAGALAAAKLGIPVAHVEAGLRSFRRDIPEEINRVITDRISSLLFAPTTTAQFNLFQEGIRTGVYLVGDVMADSVLRFREQIDSSVGVLRKWNVKPGKYLLLTLHRPYTVDDPKRLQLVLKRIAGLGEPVLFPVHPRTARSLKIYGVLDGINSKLFLMTEPFGYREMLAAERFARRVITDSGGVQREAYLLGVPCITLRDETEWVETVQYGWNTLAGYTGDQLEKAVNTSRPSERPAVFGDGRAARRIVECLSGTL